MAITRVGAGAGGNTTGAAVTYNGPNVTTSDAHTVMIVGVVISVSSNSASTTCGVTCGGVAMTQLALTLSGSSTNRSAVGLYYLVNPGTGVKSIVATPGGASTKAQVRSQAVAFNNVDSVGSAQTSAATSHSTTSVTNGYNVRVLGNGAALSSPNQTQEYLAGASVGGVGDYMAMQTAAGTGSNISFTCSGTASTPASVAVALSPVIPPGPSTETLIDLFASADGAKWDYTTPGADASVSAGELHLNNGAQLSSVDTYDLTASYALVKVVTASDYAALFLYSVARGPYFECDGSDLSAFTFPGGQVATAAYNATSHRWWRIREAGGTVYWETSPDGSTWSAFGSTAFAVSNNEGVGLFGGTATVFDNFNNPPSAAPTGSMFFSQH